MKFFTIPVTWEVYSTVEVKAESKEEAIKEFHRIENETEGFSLPTDGDYVEGSFQMTPTSIKDTFDNEELLNLIEEIGEVNDEV